MTVHVVIPARFGSTRLPGKPLVDIGGQPMVVRVAQQAARSVADDVVVAVDDQRVATAVEAAGFTAVLTDPEHTSGSDRSMQVAELMRWPDEDHIINMQGDEPLMPISVINALIEKLRALPTLEMATVSEPLEALDDFLNPNVVKVVADDSWHAMYFSRAPIPFARDSLASGTVSEDAWSELQSTGRIQRHVGIYGFRVNGLRTFVELGLSALEKIEMLEQLRWLQAGLKLLIVPAQEPVPGGVDTPADLERVQALWSKVSD